MVQETATPTEIIETPVSTPNETVEASPQDAIIPAEDATPEIPEGEPDEGPTWSPPAEDDPTYEPYKAHVEAKYEEGWKAAEEHLKPQQQATQQMLSRLTEINTKAKDAIGTLQGRLRTMQEQGLISDEGLADAFSKNPEAWTAMLSWGEEAQKNAAEWGVPQPDGSRTGGYQAGLYHGGLGTMTELYGEILKAAGRPSVMGKITPRIQQAQSGDDHKAILKDVITEVEKGYAAKLIPLGRKGGAEEEKVKQRANQKVTQGGGTPSGKSVSSMSDADARYILPDNHPDKISDADYKAARERYGIK